MARIELAGQRFGRLVVLEFAGREKGNGNALWKCQCDCGNVVVTSGHRLRKGITTSCGCYRRELKQKEIFENPKTRAHIGKIDHLIQDHSNIVAMTKVSRRNRSKVIGVSFDDYSNTWNARLFIHGKLVLNQRFRDRESAVAARRKAEEQYLTPLLNELAQNNAAKTKDASASE